MNKALQELNLILPQSYPYSFEIMAIDINNDGVLQVAHIFEKPKANVYLADVFTHCFEVVSLYDKGNIHGAEIIHFIIEQNKLFPDCVFCVDGNYLTESVHRAVQHLRKLTIKVFVTRGTSSKKFKHSFKHTTKSLLKAPRSGCVCIKGIKGNEIWFDHGYWWKKTEEIIESTIDQDSLNTFMPLIMCNVLAEAEVKPLSKDDASEITFGTSTSGHVVMKAPVGEDAASRQQLIEDKHCHPSPPPSHLSYDELISYFMDGRSEIFTHTHVQGQGPDGKLYQLIQGSKGTLRWKLITQLTEDDINAT